MTGQRNLRIWDASAWSLVRRFDIRFPDVTRNNRLWLDGQTYVIVVEDLGSHTLEELQAWTDDEFSAHLRMRIAQQTGTELSQLVEVHTPSSREPFLIPGDRNHAAYLYDLQVELPYIPLTRISFSGEQLLVYTGRPLTTSETDRFTRTCLRPVC